MTTITQNIPASSPVRRRLEGRVVLVTGGGTGIGRAAALAYAREGAKVAIAGRRIAEISRTAELIVEQGGAALPIQADISLAEDVRALVAKTVGHYGRLDIAFNNAGTEGTFAPITELTEADFDHVVGINLKGAWLSIKYEVEAILAHGDGGSIVTTSSWLADVCVAGSSAYAASKGALLAMTRALAVELGPKNIRINNVLPGIIDTPMFDRLGGTDDLAASFAAMTPARRVGLPADVGDVAVWLSTDEARFVTGQSLLVDGGYTIAGMR